MTIVDTRTGEVIEFDRAAAERRAERINLRLEAIASNYAAVMPMIREAIEKRDDLALGYRSPGEYVSDRFGRALAGLGIEVRRQVVRELTEAGMSSRAIAPVVGVDRTTVLRDIQAGGASAPPAAPDSLSDVTTGEEVTPAAPAVTGQGATAGEAPGERVEASPPLPPRRPVTGLDGKTYTTPEPRKPARKALTDSFWTAAYDLSKKVEALHRLTEDDRFPQNAGKVAASHRNDLIRYRDLLQEVINRLPSA